jgi:hypothetical protein
MWAWPDVASKASACKGSKRVCVRACVLDARLPSMTMHGCSPIDVVEYPSDASVVGISNGYSGATATAPSEPWFHGFCPVSIAARAGVHVGVHV